MKKKLSKISVLLVLMLTLAVCFAFGASAEETTYTEGNYTYTVTDGKATITAVDTAISGDITTPATLGGYPVTVIGKEAFYHCSGITSVVISEGVEVIDIGAFNDIGKVDSIVLPDSLTTLGEQPFTWVEIDSITVPANVTTIDPATFSCCYINKINVAEDNPYFSSDENGILYNKDKTELLHVPTMYEGTLVVPETVKKIGIYGIYCCLNLEDLVLPEGLEELSEGAIGLVGIKELVLPASLKTIDENSIGSLFYTEEIVVDEDNPYFSSEDGVLFNEDKTTLLYYPEGKTDRAYVVPETVTSLYNCFEVTLYLRKLTFSNDVDVLGSRGSHGCLTDIVFEEGVTKIDAGLLNSYGFRKNIYIEGMNTEMPEVRAFQTYGIHNSDPDNYAEATLQLYMMYGIPMTEAESDVVYDEWYSYSYYYDTPVNNATLHCHEGSAAETFAQENNLSYSTTHFYKDDSEWVLDFENNTATRECTACGTTTKQICAYGITDGEATIERVYIDFTGDVYLPETIDGYPLTGIDYLDYGGTNLYLHEGIKNISDGAFSGCFTNIHVDENNPYFIIEDGVLYDANKERLLRYPMYDERKYFETPETLVSIDGGAFFLAANLEKIKLNEGLKKIGETAFAYTCINGIELPSTLETIGEMAFCLSPMIEEITVPASVKYIDGYGLFTYFPVDVYLESADITFGEWESFGIEYFEMNCTREEFRDFLINVSEALLENPDDDPSNEFEVMINQLDTPITHGKFYCHEGANFIEQMDAVADECGIDTVYEYTHFFKNWTYDWDGLERTAKCLHCDETTTEALRSEEDNKIEFIATVDPETTFVVETVEDEASDNYILVTEALEAVEGPAEIEKIYDITLETSEGVAVQPDGSVQVKLPVEESHGNYKVFRVNDDGTYTDMNATVVDGYVVFVTDHFSLYVVVDTTEKACEHEFDYAKSEANLERPRQVDGTWVDGYYTYTCSLCGETETEVAKRADYTEYYVVETRFAGIFLNEDIDVNIRIKLLEELQATEVEFIDNFIESEQQTLDRFTDYLLACTERAEVCVEGTHYFTKYEEVTAPKCGVAGLEKSVCDYCGAEDEKEIPALKHSPLAAVKENEIAPDCEAAGSYESVVYCDLCGGEISRETITISAKGHSKVTVPGKAATCKETGLTDGVKCSVCGKILTAQKTIAKADHKDKNGDYKCDYGCGHEFERPTPDKCDHMCHQSGFMGFIWKIVQFFWKLFKMNPVCECGAAHY